MNSSSLTTFGPSKRSLCLSLLFLGAGFCGSTHLVSAQPIFVPNADFSNTNNYDTIQGGLVGTEVTKLMGVGPWSAHSEGILLLARPGVTIGSGQVSFSNLVTVAISGLGNSAYVYNNNIGTNFISGQTYTLTATFTTQSVIASASAFSDAGIGIELRANGNKVASTRENSDPLSVTLLSGGKSGSFSLTYTALPTVNNQSIGISMFTGEGSGLLNVGLFNGITFDNITLTAVPEPATFGILGGAMALVGAICTRRRRSRS